MTTPEDIKLTPAAYDEVVALLKSDALRAVEEPIAAAVGLEIIRDYSVGSVAWIQAEISVSGLSPKELEQYLVAHRQAIVDFAIRYSSSSATPTTGDCKPVGLSAGFGLLHGIRHNFLANRTNKEFIAFLKNRRIPAPTKEAKQARAAFEAADMENWQPSPQRDGGLPVARDVLRELFEHLDRVSMSGYACNHKFSLTEKFLRARNLPVEEMLDWLGENGAGCDCEIMFNVAPQWERIVHYEPLDADENE